MSAAFSWINSTVELLTLSEELRNDHVRSRWHLLQKYLDPAGPGDRMVYRHVQYFHWSKLFVRMSPGFGFCSLLQVVQRLVH